VNSVKETPSYSSEDLPNSSEGVTNHRSMCIVDFVSENIISNECSEVIVETNSPGDVDDKIFIPVNPTTTLWNALSAAFDYFNRELFNSELDSSKVVLNASRRSRAVGFYWPGRWKSEGIESSLDEISLNPDHMSGKTPRRIFSTLVHEMAHMWQEHFGSPSKKGYHNKEWANKMEEVGLMPSVDGSKGGKRTGPRVTHYVVEGGVYDEAFKKMPKSFQLPFTGLRNDGPKAKLGYYKFACSGCRHVVRAKSSTRVACVPCSEESMKNGGPMIILKCKGQ